MIKLTQSKKIPYSKIPCDYEGWVDAKAYIPCDYDLCFLNIKGKRITTGWACGMGWDGLYIEDKDEILYWKVKREP